MANEERVDSVIDQPAIQKELQFVASGLDDISEQIKTFPKIGKDLFDADNWKKLVKANQDYATSMAQVTKAQNENINSRKKVADLTDQELRAREKEKIDNAKRIADIKQEIKETQAAVGSIEQKRLALTRLQKQYDQLSLSARNSTDGKATLVQLQTLDVEVKKLEGTTGRFQKNVGNYGNAIAEGFKKSYGFVRTLANILPGLGISGIFLLAYEAVKKLIDVFSTGTNTINTFSANFKNLNDVMSEANKSAGKQTTDLRLLYQAATDVNVSMKDRLAAVTALKNEFPEVFKQIDNEIILNGKAKKSYDELVLSIQASSRAKAAKDKLDELEARRLDIAFQKQKIINATTNEKNRAKPKQFRDESGVVIEQTTVDEERKIIDTRKQNALKQQDVNDKSLKDQEDFLIKFAGLDNIVKTIEDRNKSKKPRTDKQDNFLEEAARRTAEFNKKTLDENEKASEGELKVLQDKYKREFEDQDRSEVDRLQSLQKFYDVSRQLTISQASGNLVQNDLTARAETQKAKDDFSKSKKTKQEKEALNDLLISIEKNRVAEEKKIIEDAHRDLEIEANAFSTESLKISKEGFAKDEKALEDHVKSLKDIHDNKIKEAETKIDNKANEDSLKVQQEFEIKINKATGKEKIKLEEELQLRLKEISEKAELERLKLVQVDLERQRDEMDALGIDTTNIEALITSNLRSQLKIRAEMHKDSNKEITDDEKEKYDKIFSYSSSALDAIQSLEDASFERLKNNIQEQIDLNDTKTKKEIDAITASGLSEQDKAARITTINAKSQAEKEQLIKKQKKADHDKAVFDKEIEILKTVGLIAIDIAEGNFLAAAAAGAALIKLIATPVPKYKHGRGEGKDEFAIVGDAYKSEPIVRADGRIELSPAKPTLTYLGAKDKVYPDIASLSKLIANAPSTDSMVNSILKANNLLHFIQQSHSKIGKPETIYEDPMANRYRKEQVRAIERVEKAILSQKNDQPIIGNSWYEQFHLKH